MGVRGEIFSTKVSLEKRTYFFNVKENRLGDLYLNIVESKNKDEGGFERQSVILFAEDLQDFLQGFDESLKVMEKAVREQKRGKKDRFEDRDEKRSRDDREGREDRSEGKRRPAFNDGQKIPGSRSQSKGYQRKAGGGSPAKPARRRNDPGGDNSSSGRGSSRGTGRGNAPFRKDDDNRPPKRKVVIKKR